MKDELKNHKPKSGNYIINLQSSTRSGTHWLSTKIVGKNCFNMDSFRKIPPKEDIDFCKRIPESTLVFSEIQMQKSLQKLAVSTVLEFLSI
jgi:hypothetical protein